MFLQLNLLLLPLETTSIYPLNVLSVKGFVFFFFFCVWINLKFNATFALWRSILEETRRKNNFSANQYQYYFFPRFPSSFLISTVGIWSSFVYYFSFNPLASAFYRVYLYFIGFVRFSFTRIIISFRFGTLRYAIQKRLPILRIWYVYVTEILDIKKNTFFLSVLCALCYYI